jgi:hypothetical protein
VVGECYKWLLVEFEYRFITKNVSIVLEIGNAKRQKQTPSNARHQNLATEKGDKRNGG